MSLRTEVLARMRYLAAEGRRSVRAWEVASRGEVLSTARVQAELEALWEAGEVDNPGAEMSTFALPRVVGSAAQLTIPGGDG